MASPIRTMWRVKAGTVGNFGDLSSVLPPACEDATPATATGVAFPANRNEWRERKSKGKALAELQCHQRIPPIGGGKCGEMELPIAIDTIGG